MKCSHCGYIREAKDRTNKHQCPYCGIVYSQYINKRLKEYEHEKSQQSTKSSKENDESFSAEELPPAFWNEFLSFFKGRLGLYTFLIITFTRSSIF